MICGKVCDEVKFEWTDSFVGEICECYLCSHTMMEYYF